MSIPTTTPMITTTMDEIITTTMKATTIVANNTNEIVNKILSTDLTPAIATSTTTTTTAIVTRTTTGATTTASSKFAFNKLQHTTAQQHQIQLQFKSNNSHNNNNSISMLSISNLLLLLLLSVCCAVCKSQNDEELFSSGDSFAAHINSNLTVLFSNNESNSNDDILLIVDHITHICQQRCIDEADLFTDDFGIKCDNGDKSEKCFQPRCAKGCQQWWRALLEFEPCQEACSSTQFYPYDMPCISACEIAQRQYWHTQRLALADYVGGIMPQLLNASVQANSLALNWPIMLPDYLLANRPFNIQYQYAVVEPQIELEQKQQPADSEVAVEVATSNENKWFYLADYNCNDNFQCGIMDGLMPYTSYRFRFELPLGDNTEDIVHSPPTAIFQTMPEGAPLSAPIVHETVAMDHRHIVVFWQPGTYINGPLIGYKIKLLDSASLVEEKFLSNTSTQYIFSNLKAQTNYTIKLAMLNGESEGPFAESFAKTKAAPKSVMNVDDMSVLVAGEYSIKLKTLEPLSDSKLIFQSEHLLADIAIVMATQQLFVLDVEGVIHSLFIETSKQTSIVELDLDDLKFKPQKISVDWLNQRLYVAGKISNSNWALVSTDFVGNALELVAANLTEQIEQLNVDPLNGWLFWTTPHGLQRMNLATKIYTYIYKTTSNNNNIGYFINDYERFLLVIYNKADDELYELSYDGSFRQKLWDNNSNNSNNNNSNSNSSSSGNTNKIQNNGSALSTSTMRLLQGAWQSFSHIENMLIATNGTYLMRYSYETNEYDNWLLRDLEWCWHVLPLQRQQQQQQQTEQQYQLQPMPIPRIAPNNLQIFLTANMAKITWSAPPALLVGEYLQSASAWQQWQYELEILDVASNSAFQIRNIRTTYFHVEKLQAQSVYKLRVRASHSRSGLLETPWSDEIITRTWPLAEHKFIWAAQHGGIYETNEIAANGKMLASITANGISEFLQLNGTLYYITTSNAQLQCQNLMNPELACMLKADFVQNLAYDWRGRRLYWIDMLRNCVVRSDLNGAAREALPIFGAQMLSVDAYNGYIYYATTTRLVRRALSGSQANDEIVFYHVNGLHDRIRGFALNLQQQQLYWLVSEHEGRMLLLQCATDATTIATKIFTPSSRSFVEDVKPCTLQYLSEVDSLLWLSQNGSTLALASLQDLQHTAWLNAPFADEIAAVHLKSEYTPYADESVVPEAVSNLTVRIDVGYWDDFTVKWDPVSTIENYTVFYKIYYNHGSVVQTLEVNEPLVRLHDLKQPQTQLNISITPHTYWRAGPTTQVQLTTPAAAPTQPKRLRVFVQRQDVPLESAPNISALIRWDPPEQNMATGASSNSAVTGYNIYCWLGAELFAEQVVHANGGPLEAIIGNLSSAETYAFQVQTMTAARATANAGEKSAMHVLHINTAVQAMPRVLYTTSEHIAVMDLDLGSSKVLVHTASEVEHVTMMIGEQRIIWVNENVELMSFVPGAAPIKLARMRAVVLSLAVDWIARIVYWAEVNTTTNAVDIYTLNLCDFEGKVMQGVRIFTLTSRRYLRDLQVLPYNRALLWLEFMEGEQQAQFVGRKLANLRPLKLKSGSWLRMFEGAQLAEQETVNLIDVKGKMCAYDLQRQLCTPQKMHFNPHADAAAVELTRDAAFIYVMRNESLRAYSRRKMGLEYLKELQHARKVKAFNYQEYPARECLVPELRPSVNDSVDTLLQPDIEELDETFITLELPSLNTNKEHCTLTMPGIKYTVSLTDSENRTRVLETQQALLNITELLPFSSYKLQVNISTYYQQKLGLPMLISAAREVRTTRGTPTEPQNFEAIAVSPHEIQVSWTEPAVLNTDRVQYELHWQQVNATHMAQRLVNETELNLSNLDENESYLLQLKVYAMPHKFNETKPVIVTTYEKPQPLELLESTPYNLTLSWTANADFASVLLVCETLNADDAFSIDISSNTSHIVVMDLLPKTRYQFHLELQYAPNARAYRWPEFSNERFIFETLGDSPSAPGRPQIELITGEIFKIFWEPAHENGAPIIEYGLEALQIHKRVRRSNELLVDNSNSNTSIVGNNNKQNSNNSSINNSHSLLTSLPWLEEPQVLEDKWISYCNTSELSCIVRDLHTQHLLLFRVRARNQPYGWGPYSIASEYVAEPFVTAEKRSSLIWAIIAPAGVVSTCVVVLFIMKKLQTRRLRAKQKLLEKSRPSIWSNLSAAQQHHLMSARNRGFSITSNSTSFCGGMSGAGGSPLSDADIALLPQIKWSQIAVLNFLGSGAFGEVYEGLLRSDDDEKPEKVAIKCLRKGSSEFSELLQEAQLMSNFKHENIVRLIGICFDTESISIIMEHMEGGDLLSYLREARPSSPKALASLQLIDLITMCIDVATGCSYLEDMHFVHRDLACRNCLVSSRQPSQRVVKIGDFGLARDIYKNDYYRKEGEGLLPVRWMAPESLIDGIFTTQSDVWSFGVLCWEILTLGRQPYAVRNNFDVLNFVKDGGRLEQPDNCPDKLFSLMRECWRTDADERPTFRRCVNTLISIKTDVRRINLGYNLDDVEEHAMYANSQGILLSNFLSTPLPKLPEETVDEIDSLSIKSENVTWPDTRVRFAHEIKENDLEKSFELTNATKPPIYKRTIVVNSFSNDNPDYLCSNNDGVSRF